MAEENQQELIMKLSAFEQQIRALQEQLQAVEEAITQTNLLSVGMQELKNAKDKEILAGIGKGIFVKANITSEELIVDVGNKNYVKKSVADTKQLIEEQHTKLENVKADLEKNLEEINSELTKTFMAAQKKS